MIVYFEGLSCVGKTTLISEIEHHHPEVIVIPELVNKINRNINMDEFCRRNDERKCQMAKRHRNNIVLVDRCYPSTLTYNYIQYRLGLTKEYPKTLDWYIEGIRSGSLIKPDFYVFVSADKETIFQRARVLKKLKKTIAWYLDPDIGAHFFRSFFEFFEPEIPVLDLNGSGSVNELAKYFLKSISPEIL